MQLDTGFGRRKCQDLLSHAETVVKGMPQPALASAELWRNGLRRMEAH